jgi:hypothetical protein
MMRNKQASIKITETRMDPSPLKSKARGHLKTEKSEPKGKRTDVGFQSQVKILGVEQIGEDECLGEERKGVHALGYTSIAPSMNQIVYNSNNSLRIRSDPRNSQVSNWINLLNKNESTNELYFRKTCRMFQLDLHKNNARGASAHGNLAETLKSNLYVEAEDREHFYVGKKEKELKIFKLYHHSPNRMRTMGNENIKQPTRNQFKTTNNSSSSSKAITKRSRLTAKTEQNDEHRAPNSRAKFGEHNQVEFCIYPAEQLNINREEQVSKFQWKNFKKCEKNTHYNSNTLKSQASSAKKDIE